MNILKKLPFYRNYRTNSLKKWWANRKIDWHKDYTATWNLPRRHLLVSLLASFQWVSLMEVGCGGGANLVAIAKYLHGKQLGGVDINADAIEAVKPLFQGHGLFYCCSGDDILMSDKSVDVMLADMMYIYVAPRQIDRYMEELKRVGRNYVVLCEFYSPYWWDRFMIRLKSGHNAYDWREVLEKHDFYDIMIYKVPEEMCQDETQKKFSHIIMARVPTR